MTIAKGFKRRELSNVKQPPNKQTTTQILDGLHIDCPK